MGFFSMFLGRGTANKHSTQFISWGTGFSFKREEIDQIINCGYLANPDVYSIIKKVSDVCQTIPLKVYKQVDGKDVEIEDSELLDLISKPSEHQTTADFLENCIVNLLNTGNAFIKVTKPVGFSAPAEMRVLRSSMVDIVVNEDWTVKEYIYTDSLQHHYKTEEIIHIKYVDPSTTGAECLYGLSPMQAALVSLDASNHSNEATSQLFKNKGMSGFLSSNSEVMLTETQGKQLQDAMQEQISGRSVWGKITVTPIDVKYVQTGMSPADLKITENKIQFLRVFCNIFGVDSSLFNDPQNKTYSNRADAVKDLYTNAVIPVLNKILRELNKFLIEEDDTAIKPDLSAVPALQKDKQLEARRLSILVKDGILTVNEAREEMGLGPIKIVQNVEE